MFECDLLGMKMQSGCRLVAVERIADDGSIQTLLMSTMHAQLVRSTRLRIERDAKMGAVDALQNFILRNGLLALLVIYHLAGAVQIIGQQRKRDVTLPLSFFQNPVTILSFPEMMATYFFCTR